MRQMQLLSTPPVKKKIALPVALLLLKPKRKEGKTMFLALLVDADRAHHFKYFETSWEANEYVEQLNKNIL